MPYPAAVIAEFGFQKSRIPPTHPDSAGHHTISVSMDGAPGKDIDGTVVCVLRDDMRRLSHSRPAVIALPPEVAESEASTSLRLLDAAAGGRVMLALNDEHHRTGSSVILCVGGEALSLSPPDTDEPALPGPPPPHPVPMNPWEVFDETDQNAELDRSSAGKYGLCGCFLTQVRRQSLGGGRFLTASCSTLLLLLAPPYRSYSYGAEAVAMRVCGALFPKLLLPWNCYTFGKPMKECDTPQAGSVELPVSLLWGS
jgi:hypothetical protein